MAIKDSWFTTLMFVLPKMALILIWVPLISVHMEPIVGQEIQIYQPKLNQAQLSINPLRFDELYIIHNMADTSLVWRQKTKVTLCTIFKLGTELRTVFRRKNSWFTRLVIKRSDKRGSTIKWNTVGFECTTSINIKLTSTPLSPPPTITTNFQNRQHFLWRSSEVNILTVKSPWVQRKYEATGSCTCRQSLWMWVWWGSPCCVSLRCPSVLSDAVVCSRSSGQTSASNNSYWVQK